jgi:very-short-patch-repair endonuclease
MAADDKKTERARSLRKDDVPAQRRLWSALRNRALGGYKFRRQHQVAQYFADFACVECMVIVESDGPSHLENRRTDQRRTKTLENFGWLVLRYWNTEIYDDIDAVKEAIYRECVRRHAIDEASPSP